MAHDGMGNQDANEWFRNENLEGLEKLVNEDDERMRELDGHQQAIARRAVIFVIDECLFDGQSQSATDAAASAVREQQMQNATPRLAAKSAVLSFLSEGFDRPPGTNRTSCYVRISRGEQSVSDHDLKILNSRLLSDLIF